MDKTRQSNSSSSDAIPKIKPKFRNNVNNLPYRLFNLFFDNGTFEEIPSETSRHCKKSTITKQQNTSKPKSSYAQRPEASIHKIKIFIAIVIHMCLVRKPSLLDHWTNLMHKLCNKRWDVSR
jgi:hypothetical protein